MGAFVAKCDAIRQRTGATVLIVHHSGKNAAMGARGHSALRAAVDAEFEVERSGDHRILRVRKSRDGADGAEMGFKLHVVEVGRDNLDDDQGVGTPITSCVVLPADVAPTKVAKVSRTKVTPTLRAFMDAVRMGLRDHGHSITPFPDGPTVRAVDSEKVRASYYTMRADDLAENSRRTVFARHLGNAADRQAIVTRMIDGVTMIWLPTRA
jgi:hypothetical protein